MLIEVILIPSAANSTSPRRAIVAVAVPVHSGSCVSVSESYIDVILLVMVINLLADTEVSVNFIRRGVKHRVGCFHMNFLVTK